jgi:hypothetical protein
MAARLDCDARGTGCAITTCCRSITSSTQAPVSRSTPRVDARDRRCRWIPSRSGGVPIASLELGRRRLFYQAKRLRNRWDCVTSLRIEPPYYLADAQARDSGPRVDTLHDPRFCVDHSIEGRCFVGLADIAISVRCATHDVQGLPGWCLRVCNGDGLCCVSDLRARKRGPASPWCEGRG